MKEVEFLDRVPTYPGRVTLTPVEGQANTYDMVRADVPRVPGTPLDKATFESVVHSRLTGRYYTPVLSRVADSSRAGLTVSPIPTSGWVYYDPNDSLVASNGQYGLVVSSESYVNSAHEVLTGEGWESMGGLESWIEIYHAQAIRVRTFRFTLEAQVIGRLSTIQFLGANEDKNWMALSTFAPNADGTFDFALEYTGEFKYYKIVFNSTSSNRIKISDLRYILYDIAQYVNQYTESQGFPTEWTLGQRVTIATPANASTFAVTGNTLNGLPIYTILQPSKMYELIYADGGFAAKEV